MLSSEERRTRGPRCSRFDQEWPATVQRSPAGDRRLTRRLRGPGRVTDATLAWGLAEGRPAWSRTSRLRRPAPGAGCQVIPSRSLGASKGSRQHGGDVHVVARATCTPAPQQRTILNSQTRPQRILEFAFGCSCRREASPDPLCARTVRSVERPRQDHRRRRVRDHP